MARPGDLLLIFADAITRTWKQVIHFRPPRSAPAERRRPAGARRGAGRYPTCRSDEATPLVRDERGVRLARETRTEGEG